MPEISKFLSEVVISNKDRELIIWLLVAFSAALSIIGAMPFAVSFGGNLGIIDGQT